jgi:Holliday junction DNA helicase RuvA
MIATLSGPVAEKIGDSVVIELGGVGYEVVTTAEDWGSARIGEPIKFYIYEHIREDAHLLFGFSTLGAKDLFMKLLGVSGVGPKVAMQVMGAASLERLVSAISMGDADLFKGVSGVGKKTAERIMIELRGKVEGLAPIGGMAMPAASVGSGDPAYQALIGLGYKPSQAAEAVAQIPADITDEQERVKSALKGVAK